MNAKMIGATLTVAVSVMFPLSACGSSTPPAPTATVAPTPTTLSSGFRDSYCNINSSTRKACEQYDAEAAKPQAQSTHQDSGLPWWAWLLIVPAGLVALLVLGIKLAEANDERTIARANARVYELESRPRPVLDYDDYEDDEDDELDELPEDDIDFLHRVTDPAPSAPAPSTSTAGGNLLSSLRQQGGGVQ
ncbi:hypothetical protein ACM0AZ_12640 [Mycobacteroides abscessus subsp. massiliense]|uniref:hypothetical protein n=1 Tax=Mycobacteroides abscessus TaxID=36809 RepID=UPI000928FB1E|nr:hypothetical protein [Mycobacteroides abscessus]MBN7467065.1 hypothetical protein [Mycobacteroides abscessus subsp. massiliense]SHZ38704.1 Uncharacterised protein [Mycobacteroides abscessus subsp. abscessus]SLI53900.1 putative lipoprotein [Mycobacteroides abscessus subsp. massiliense]